MTTFGFFPARRSRARTLLAYCDPDGIRLAGRPSCHPDDHAAAPVFVFIWC